MKLRPALADSEPCLGTSCMELNLIFCPCPRPWAVVFLSLPRLRLQLLRQIVTTKVSCTSLHTSRTRFQRQLDWRSLKSLRKSTWLSKQSSVESICWHVCRTSRSAMSKSAMCEEKDCWLG